MSRFTSITAAIVLASLSFGTQAATELDKRVEAATEVLQDLNRIPEQAVPPNLLNRAYAVAVIPNVIKGGFIVGGSFGRGILVVRQDDGSWSNPAFIRLTNVSVGWQIGAQGSDLLLVFKSRQGVDQIARGKFTIGGSASASAGPVGRTAAAATDGEFKSEIYTYSRSRGLFAGVSLDGGALLIEHDDNELYYDGQAASTDAIFDNPAIPTPPAAQTFRDTLSAMTPRLNARDQAAARSPQPPAAENTTRPVDQGPKTYAIEETAQPAPETLF